MRRHIPRFTYYSVSLTDKLKKETQWAWTSDDEAELERLKDHLSHVLLLGSPRPKGEFVCVTDASDLGGGAALFQWQHLSKDESTCVNAKLSEYITPTTQLTKGMKRDGTLDHEYPEGHYLVPLGNWSWKWNQSRQNYSTFEKELMAGVLVLSGQRRLIGSNPVIWFFDQFAVEHFVNK